QRLPTQFAQKALGHSVDQPVDSGKTARVNVPRNKNAEGAGLGDRFAQQINQGVTNAGVADASRGEQKPHAASPSHGNPGRWSPLPDGKDTAAERIQWAGDGVGYWRWRSVVFLRSLINRSKSDSAILTVPSLHCRDRRSGRSRRPGHRLGDS